MRCSDVLKTLKVTRQTICRCVKETLVKVTKNDTNIPLDGSLERKCFLCKYFSEFQCHGSRLIGECLKKENMVWCPPTRYHGRHKDYKTVFEDDICQHFERKDSCS